MKQYHHFEISSNMPGVLNLKLFTDSGWAPSVDYQQSAIVPPGLSHKQQQYLHNSLRP